MPAALPRLAPDGCNTPEFTLAQVPHSHGVGKRSVTARASAGERRAASVVGDNSTGIGRHYCAWIASRDGSGVTQVQVPDDIMTRNGYGSSYKFLLNWSNKGKGLLCSQLSNSGSAMSTTQRYVVKDGKLEADGDAIQSQAAGELAPEVKSEMVELNFVDTSDRSLLEALSKGEKIPTADDKQTQSQDSQPKERATDKAIADAKAKGLVELTGTVRKMNGNDAADLCVNLGVLDPTLAEDPKTIPKRTVTYLPSRTRSSFSTNRTRSFGDDLGQTTISPPTELIPTLSASMTAWTRTTASI